MMRILHVISSLAVTSVTLSYPIDIRSSKYVAVRSTDSSNATESLATTSLSTTADSSDIKTDSLLTGGPTTAKAITPQGNAKAFTGFSRTPSVAAVQQASANFAQDANTVSASLNQMPSETNAKTIKSLAATAFNAESDEDEQRAVLAAAAGFAGSTSNVKIVTNTPTVLTGLRAIMNNPTSASVSKNVATIENARNPNILPSITQLSNSALKAVGSTQTQQKFPATTGLN